MPGRDVAYNLPAKRLAAANKPHTQFHISETGIYGQIMVLQLIDGKRVLVCGHLERRGLALSRRAILT